MHMLKQVSENKWELYITDDGDNKRSPVIKKEPMDYGYENLSTEKNPSMSLKMVSVKSEYGIKHNVGPQLVDSVTQSLDTYGLENNQMDEQFLTEHNMSQQLPRKVENAVPFSSIADISDQNLSTDLKICQIPNCKNSKECPAFKLIHWKSYRKKPQYYQFITKHYNIDENTLICKTCYTKFYHGWTTCSAPNIGKCTKCCKKSVKRLKGK